MSAAEQQSAGCVMEGEVLVTLKTLFPSRVGKVFAEWYTGTLHIQEGKAYPAMSYSVTYESTLLVDIRAGMVIGEQRRKNDPPQAYCFVCDVPIPSGEQLCSKHSKPDST